MSPLECVSEAELFAGLSEAERASVAALGRERGLAPGEVLFRLGDLADTFYVIERGRVELTFPLVVMGEAKEARLQSLEPRRTLAWSALVPPHRLTMSARGTTDVALLAFDREAVLRLLAAQPSIGHVVMANLARVVASRLHELLALWVREVQRNVAQTYR